MIKSVRVLVLVLAAVVGTLVVTDSASAQILPWRRHHNECCKATCCPPAPTCCAPTGGCNACGSCPTTGYAHHRTRRHHADPCCTPCSYTASLTPSCCGGGMTVAATTMPAPPVVGVAPMPLPTTAQPGTTAAPPTAAAPVPAPMAPAPVAMAPLTGGCCGTAVASTGCGCEDPCAGGRHRRFHLFHRQ